MWMTSKGNGCLLMDKDRTLLRCRLGSVCVEKSMAGLVEADVCQLVND